MFILFISEKSPWNFPCFKPMTSHWNPLKPMGKIPWNFPWVTPVRLGQTYLGSFGRISGIRNWAGKNWVGAIIGWWPNLGKTMEKTGLRSGTWPLTSWIYPWIAWKNGDVPSSFFVCLPDGNTVGKRTVVLQVIQVSRKTWPCRISRRKPPACSSWQTFTRPGTKCGVDYHSHTPW